MINDKKEEIVRYFTKKILSKEIEFDEVRKQLEVKKLDEQEIKELVKAIDQELLTNPYHREDKNYVINKDGGLGILFSILGVLLVGATSLDLIELGESWFWSFSLLISGLSIIFAKRVRKRGRKFTSKDKFK